MVMELLVCEIFNSYDRMLREHTLLLIYLHTPEKTDVEPTGSNDALVCYQHILQRCSSSIHPRVL